MPDRVSYAAYIELHEAEGRTLYQGEAIYRPRKPHPLTGEPAPQIGIPDDAMAERPERERRYRIWFNGEEIPTTDFYLERVVTFWWFLLEHAPRHPPTA